MKTLAADVGTRHTDATTGYLSRYSRVSLRRKKRGPGADTKTYLGAYLTVKFITIPFAAWEDGELGFGNKQMKA